MPDPRRPFIAAHATLADTARRWPLAQTNLAHLQGGWPGVIPAWPTGHTGAATIDNPAHDYPPDPCRADLRNIDNRLKRIVNTAADVLDVPVNPHTTITGQLWYAMRLLELVTHRDMTLTDQAHEDGRVCHREADEVYAIVVRWTFTSHRPVIATIGVETVDWCANHARFGMRDEPVTPLADTPLCDFCWSFQRTTGRRPERKIIERRQAGKLTSRDVA